MNLQLSEETAGVPIAKENISCKPVEISWSATAQDLSRTLILVTGNVFGWTAMSTSIILERYVHKCLEIL